MTRLGDRALSLLIWSAALPVFVACCLSVWAASFVLPGPLLERWIKLSCRLVLFVCGIRVQVQGAGHVRPGRAYIVMMNHVNFLDPLVLYGFFPGYARGVEEESHFRWPVYGPTIRRLGVIPLSRTDRDRAYAGLRRASVWIRTRPDYSFIVLPEGTRTRDGRLGRFKRGGFLLAIQTGRPILPIAQVGAYAIARKGSLLIRPGRIELRIGAALSPAGYAPETAAELVDRVRTALLGHLDG
jgi:1-acyl-sn-glycerol-3-phosphate acyltransferase